jgi:hypothetical protein
MSIVSQMSDIYRSVIILQIYQLNVMMKDVENLADFQILYYM